MVGQGHGLDSIPMICIFELFFLKTQLCPQNFPYRGSKGISPQSCTETDFEMKTSNFVLFLLISVVSVHFRAIDDETIPCQA